MSEGVPHEPQEPQDLEANKMRLAKEQAVVRNEKTEIPLPPDSETYILDNKFAIRRVSPVNGHKFFITWSRDHELLQVGNEGGIRHNPAWENVADHYSQRRITLGGSQEMFYNNMRVFINRDDTTEKPAFSLVIHTTSPISVDPLPVSTTPAEVISILQGRNPSASNPNM